MAVPFSNTHLRVPPGFANILWCLAREVLREQPDNIIQFGMEYFKKLLLIRRGNSTFKYIYQELLETGEDDIAKLGAVSDDRYYNDHSFKIPSSTFNSDMANP
ncbi:unnamed protein product [Hymenolepis diminuta]|uniref:RIIa domain-containing protein n=1 Tax=Hymenolepis diminuta TaxID=6216 RepID=A0A0R3SSL0_HYMDI|nr:unnamed protein product [Hymenolepis diminuta]